MARSTNISGKTIGRLSLYRRLLTALSFEGKAHIYSHELANMAGVTAAQVRRDFMVIGYSGSPVNGYHVTELIRCVSKVLDNPEGSNVALVGVGHLGRAILNYFQGRRPKLQIVAAFDRDEHKVNRVIQGVRSYPLSALKEVVAERRITVAIITVPASSAQEIANLLVEAGVRGIVNFAPVPLRLPEEVSVEDMDITTLLEKVAYFSGISDARKERMEP